MKLHNARRRQVNGFQSSSLVESLETRRMLANVVVNTTIDGIFPPSTGLTSLRTAIAIANTATTPTTISFDPTAFATPKSIVLNGTRLEITGSQATTITGPIAGVTIDANSLSSVLYISSSASTSLSRMTLTKGNNGAEFFGGWAASISLSNVTVTGNSGRGILIYDGTATLTNVTVSGNTVHSNPTHDYDGGGIYNRGSATLTNVTVSGHTARHGGGIYNIGEATLTNVTVSGNTATNGSGGGIFNNGTATLTNVTVSGNTATSTWSAHGGGIYNRGTSTLTNVTVSGNTSSHEGGGIYNGHLTVTVTLTNSIVAGNLGSPSNTDVAGAFNSLGYNVIGKTDGSTGFNAADYKGTIASPLNAKLAALANNGGPTMTMLPLAGSPVINKGFNLFIPAGITKDQRGLPRIANTTVDIGAVEVQPTTATPEALVQGKGIEIVDGDSSPATTDDTHFGTVNIGTPVTRTFTVKNTGTVALTTSGLTVPAGFSIDPTDLLAASIPAGGQDTFKVKLNATAAGTFTGNISFANNDANENPYNFAIRGVVNVPTFSLVNNVLTVTGTIGNDFIRGSIASNVLTMKVNNLTQTFANASSITRIVVNALAGNDNISLAQSVNRATSLFGGDGNDTIYGGSGTDAINGGAGTDVAFRNGTDTTTLVEEILA